MPFSWIPGNGKMDGLTLWRTIYVQDRFWSPDALNQSAIELLFHELTHVEQFRRNPVRFPVKYLIDHFRFGYFNNPAEVEARERAAQLAADYFKVARSASERL
jgi:hypothetical protein